MKPLARRSYTLISPLVSAFVLAKPTSSNVSRLISTPPASARSRVQFEKPVAAVATAMRDEEQAPSTVYPPPCRSRKLQILPAMVLERFPARVSSVIGAKADL